MKRDHTLTITSVLSVVLFTIHLTDDIVRGFEPGILSNLVGGVVIMVVWLYAALELPDRWPRYVILLLWSILGTGVSVLHFSGGVGRIAKTSGSFLFIGTLIALGVTAFYSVILSARGLWGLRRGKMASLTGFEPVSPP